MNATKSRLEDRSEILFRQVHPKFFHLGRISSQAFEAPRSHDGKLSVDREALTSADKSFELYTDGFGRESACVCGVSVGEVTDLELEALSDPLEQSDDHPANPAHALIELAHLGRSGMKKKANRLVSKARERGILYHP